MIYKLRVIYDAFLLEYNDLNQLKNLEILTQEN